MRIFCETNNFSAYLAWDWWMKRSRLTRQGGMIGKHNIFWTGAGGSHLPNKKKIPLIYLLLKMDYSNLHSYYRERVSGVKIIEKISFP